MRALLPRKTLLHASIWAAAGTAGAIAVLYARLIAWAQSLFTHTFHDHPYLVSLATPVLFLVATGVVQLFAIEAKGSGIPQVLEAIALSRTENEKAGIWVNR